VLMEVFDSFLAANVSTEEMTIACRKAESALGHKYMFADEQGAIRVWRLK
jgi:hypothetical protein